MYETRRAPTLRWRPNSPLFGTLPPAARDGYPGPAPISPRRGGLTVWRWRKLLRPPLGSYSNGLPHLGSAKVLPENEWPLRGDHCPSPFGLGRSPVKLAAPLGRLSPLYRRRQRQLCGVAGILPGADTKTLSAVRQALTCSFRSGGCTGTKRHARPSGTRNKLHRSL